MQKGFKSINVLTALLMGSVFGGAYAMEIPDANKAMKLIDNTGLRSSESKTNASPIPRSQKVFRFEDARADLLNDWKKGEIDEATYYTMKEMLDQDELESVNLAVEAHNRGEIKLPTPIVIGGSEKSRGGLSHSRNDLERSYKEGHIDEATYLLLKSELPVEPKRRTLNLSVHNKSQNNTNSSSSSVMNQEAAKIIDRDEFYRSANLENPDTLSREEKNTQMDQAFQYLKGEGQQYANQVMAEMSLKFQKKCKERGGKIDYSRNSLPKLLIECLAKFLETDTMAKEVNLQGCGLDNKDADLLLNALKKNKTVASIKLEGNNISQDRINALGIVVRSNRLPLQQEVDRSNIDPLRDLQDAYNNGIMDEETYLLARDVCLRDLHGGYMERLSLHERYREIDEATKIMENEDPEKLDAFINEAVSKLKKQCQEKKESNSLIYAGKPLPKLYIRALAKFFETDRQIEELDIQNCGLDDKDARILLEGVKQNSTLRVIKFKGNNIKDSDGRFLGNIERDKRFLDQLKMDQKVFQSNKTILKKAATIALPYPFEIEIKITNFDETASGLPHEEEIKAVNDATSRLSKTEYEAIVSEGVYQHHKTTQEMNFKKIEFSDKKFEIINFEILGRFLETDTRIEKLVLKGCSLKDAEAFRLANALKKNKTLRFINLENNHIGEWGAMAFINVFGSNCISNPKPCWNTTVKCLNLEGNPVSKGTKDRLARGINLSELAEDAHNPSPKIEISLNKGI